MKADLKDASSVDWMGKKLVGRKVDLREGTTVVMMEVAMVDS